MNKTTAEIVREYGPFPDVEGVHGVTFDGRSVWFASGDDLQAIDPESGQQVRSLDVPAHAGTAFDGRHLYQIAKDRIEKIDPATGEILQQLDLPEGVNVSGLESDGADLFYCGGGPTGKVRAVRRPA